MGMSKPVLVELPIHGVTPTTSIWVNPDSIESVEKANTYHSVAGGFRRDNGVSEVSLASGRKILVDLTCQQIVSKCTNEVW